MQTRSCKGLFPNGFEKLAQNSPTHAKLREGGTDLTMYNINVMTYKYGVGGLGNL